MHSSIICCYKSLPCRRKKHIFNVCIAYFIRRTYAISIFFRQSHLPDCFFNAFIHKHGRIRYRFRSISFYSCRANVIWSIVLFYRETTLWKKIWQPNITPPYIYSNLLDAYLDLNHNDNQRITISIRKIFIIKNMVYNTSIFHLRKTIQEPWQHQQIHF